MPLQASQMYEEQKKTTVKQNWSDSPGPRGYKLVSWGYKYISYTL